MTMDGRHAQAERWRRAFSSMRGAVLARVIGTACGVIQVPLSLRLLGLDGFGAWAALSAIVGLSLLLDGGTSYALQNAVVEASTRRDSRRVRSLVRVALRLQLIAGLTAAATGGAAWVVARPTVATWIGQSGWNVDEHWLNLVVLLSLLHIAALPTYLSLRLAFALQMGWLAGLHSAFVSVTTLVLVLVATATQWPPARFIVVASTLPLVLNVLLLAWLRRYWSGGAPVAPEERDQPEMLAFARQSLVFWLPQVGSALHQHFPPAVVAVVAGPAAMAPFSLILRLFNFALLLPQWWLESLWPAMTDAHVQGDRKWNRTAVRRSLLVVGLGAAFPLTLGPWWAPKLLAWWTKLPATAFPSELVLAIGLSLASTTVLATASVWLNAVGRPHGQAIYGTIASIVLVTALPPAVAAAGVIAAPLTTLAITAGVLVPGMIIDMAKTRLIVSRTR